MGRVPSREEECAGGVATFKNGKGKRTANERTTTTDRFSFVVDRAAELEWIHFNSGGVAAFV
jgi:hypothetical protein